MCRTFAGRTFILMLVAAASGANGQEPGKKDSKLGRVSDMTSEAEQFTQRWYQAWLEKEAAAIERMMADHYVSCHGRRTVASGELLCDAKRPVRSSGETGSILTMSLFPA